MISREELITEHLKKVGFDPNDVEAFEAAKKAFHNSIELFTDNTPLSSTTRNNNYAVMISRATGELVGISRNGISFMHGGGLPEEFKTEADKKGWQKSEIVMFPIVGAVSNYQVRIGDRAYAQDHHGIARILGFPFTYGENVLHTQRFQTQVINEPTPLPNPKHEKDPAHPAVLEWPFAYDLSRQILLQDRSVKVFFEMCKDSGKEEMPFMFGWHPGFRMLGSPAKGFFQANHKTIPLEKIIEVAAQRQGHGAYKIPGIHDITYWNEENGLGIRMTTKGFGNMMLWCPGAETDMFCIEPVTHLPSEKKEYFINPEEFDRITITDPIRRYSAEITLLRK